MLRLAINGFGRIGRAALKIALEKNAVQVVAINDLAPARVLAHLLKYDSVYGIYPKEVMVEEAGQIIEKELWTLPKAHFEEKTPEHDEFLVVDGQRIKILVEKDPAALPWKELKVDVVLECTGRFTKDGSAGAHLQAGAQRVIISAPAKGGNVPTFLLGANAENYQGQTLISNASCTTNCVSPITRIIEENFGVIKAAITTIHAVTAEQNLVDGPPPVLHEDLRRGRAALQNIVPTTTGAATATAEVFPQIKGKFDGLAIRVPVLCGSLSDFTFLVKRTVTVEGVNHAFLEAEKNPYYQGILITSPEPLVSSDIVGNSASTIVDLSMTQVIDQDLVKVLAWYDNEWGYSNRLVELAIEIGKNL